MIWLRSVWDLERHVFDIRERANHNLIAVAAIANKWTARWGGEANAERRRIIMIICVERVFNKIKDYKVILRCQRFRVLWHIL
jgi:hypothetical protein